MGSCWGQGEISNAVVELLLTFLVSTVLHLTQDKWSDPSCCFGCYMQLVKWKTSAGGTGSPWGTPG